MCLVSEVLDWKYDSTFDGGDKGCGELLLDLKIYFRPLEPGAKVLVIARDEAASTEMAAWCRLTRNALLEAHHPYYLVRRKDA